MSNNIRPQTRANTQKVQVQTEKHLPQQQHQLQMNMNACIHTVYIYFTFIVTKGLIIVTDRGSVRSLFLCKDNKRRLSFLL